MKDKELEHFGEWSEGRLQGRDVQDTKMAGRVEPAKHSLGESAGVRRGSTLGIF